MLETCTLAITTTGDAGTATGSITTGILTGYIYDVYIDYHASAPATTDVTVAYAVPAGGNILVRTSSATDGRFLPRLAVCDAAASALTAYDKFYVNGTLTVSVAQCDAIAAAVTVTIRYDPNDWRVER